MNRRYLLFFIAGLLLSLALVPSSVQSQEVAEPAGSYVRLVRATDLDELGIGRAFGFTYTPAENAFLFLEDDFSPPSGPTGVTFKVLSELEEVVSTAPLAASGSGVANVAFDAQGNRYLLLDESGDEMSVLGADSRGRPRPDQLAGEGIGRLGVRQPVGLAFDPSLGSLYILDAAGPSLVRVDLGGAEQPGQAPFHRIGLSTSGLAAVAGLALDPASGNLHIFDPSSQTLHELSTVGRPVAVRDVSGMGIDNLQGMLFAPSGDLTDDPAKLSLYLLDGPAGHPVSSGGTGDGPAALTSGEGGTGDGSGELLELSFQAALAPAAATITTSLVQTINAYQFNPPSPDSAGVAYLPDSNNLLISDSEVNEMQIFRDVNLFQSTLSGTLVDTMSTMAYSDEPTGIDVNPANRHLFISDDTSREIYEVNPGGDGQYDTSDDVVTVAFKTRDLNFTDPEGVAYDSWGNRMLIADGKSAEIIIVSPGNNGVFDGAPPTGDDTAVTIDTSAHGITDPEGVAFNYENGNVYVVGRPPTVIAEMTLAGSPVQTIDISAAAADKPAGLAYGPRSNNPGARSIYVAERGVDNGADPNENDGRVYEMALPTTSPAPPTAVDDEAATDQATLVTIDVAANDYDVNGNLDVTTTNILCGGCSTTLNGLLVNNGDGTFDYTPNAPFTGVDTFVYEICDDGALCSTATVTITVSAPNDPPVANDDEATTAEETAITIDVAANDSDPEGGLDLSSTNASCTGCSLPGSGTLQNNGDGTFDYDPNQDFFGNDSFVYEICDTDALCATASVAITVSNTPDFPVAADDLVVTTEGVTTTIDVAINDDDPDGDLDPATTNTSCSSCSTPNDGSLQNNGDGTFEYTPDTGFVGSDGFTYEICDATNRCDTAAVSITVNELQIIYLSSTSNGNANGLAFDDDDIVAYNAANDSWSMHFDGSDVGLAADINAFHLNPDGSILLSIAAAATLPDVGSVDDSDIVRFVPTSLGDATAGAFEMYFDGSDVELGSNGEDVDAIGLASDGRLLVSPTGSFSTSGASGLDEDIFAFTATSLGANTAGSWALYFDGSMVGLADATSEDVNATWIGDNGDIYLAVRGAFSVPGVSGDGAAIFSCQPLSADPVTSCTYSPYWDGSAFGFGGELIDGLTVVSGPSAPSYNLAVTTQGSGLVALSPPGGSYPADTIVTLTATPDPDWDFAGWSGELGGTTNPITLTMDADKSVTANFTIKQYELITGTVGPGSVTLNPDGGSYDAQSVVTLTAAGDPGYEFDQWIGDLSGTLNPAMLTMDSDKMVTATFKIIEYDLNVTEVGNGTVTLDPAGGTYDPDTVVTLTATADSQWNFAGWSGDLGGATNPITLTMDADKSVTATFTTTQYELSVSEVGDGSGSVILDPPGGTYNAGTEVTLTAVAGPHSDFTGWSGDASGGTNPITVTVDADRAVTASFTLKQYDLNVSTDGPGSVALNPVGGLYEALTVVTLTASPDPNEQFLGWSGDLVGAGNPITLTMDGDKSVTATFGQVTDVTYEETVTGGSSGSTTVSTLDPVPAGAGHLYLAAVSTKNYVDVTAVDGLGLTWHPLREQCGGRNQTGVEVWWAQGSPTAGKVMATMASAANNAVIAVSRYSGVESLNPTIGPQVVSANSNGVEGACSGGSDGTYYSVDLTTTAVNSVVYGVAALRNKTNEPGAGFTERIEMSQGNGGGMAGISVEDKTVEFPTATVVDGTLSKNSDWAVIGVEIRPNGSGPTLYSLATHTVGQGSIALSPSAGPYADGTVVTLTANPDSGWQFDNWSGDLAGSTNPMTLTMDANKDVTATFSQIPVTQYTLTLGTEGSGSVTLSPPGGVYDEGTVVTLTPAPDSGWIFTGWSGDLTGDTTPETLTMNGNKAVTATFEVSVQFSPTSYSVDEGIGTATIDVTLSAAASQEVTVDYATSDGSATAVDDYTAKSGTLTFEPGVTLQSFGVPINDDLDEETSETVNLTLTAPSNAILGTPDDQATLTITDNDTPPAVQYTLTVATEGGGSVDLDPTSGVYDENTVVNLTAVADTHREFSHWSGDLTGTANPAALTMNANKAVTATFTRKQYTLTVGTIGNGSVTLDPPGGTYGAMTVVTVTATADTGYDFNGWSGDLVSSSNPLTLTMDAEKALTATFSEQGSGGQVTHEGTVAGGSSDSASVSTDVAVTAAANDLYLAAIATKNHVAVSTVDGMGLAWTQVDVQCAGRNATGISVWKAQGSPSGDEMVTATLSKAPRNAVIAVTRYSGVATSNPLGDLASLNTNGIDGACSGGTDSNSYSVDITTTVPDALVYSALGMRTAENTPGAGYGELVELVHGVTGPAGIAVQQAMFPTPSTVPANGTLNKNVDWAVIALEIKPG